MKFMKKLFLYAIILSCLSIVLAACSDEEETAPPKNKPEEVPQVPEEVEIEIPAVSDEALYQTVVDELEAAGFTVGEPEEAAIAMFRAVSGMTLTVNGETLLPLHLYKLPESDERLQVLDETGQLPVYLGSKTEQLAVKRIDHFIIYLHKGHPDYEGIMKVIDEM